ncbi:hypothetical protein OVS_02320 [Mycoplasma ovis str. Michigan]|uniref:DUF31 domain-containing protein n=1 Tax=Mycoplasma ovis str. Michigan TaxID=1415773 RepID=A0ABN4BN85_9MOLU|nr:hypothetical protein OVS_02320 [Mycoplasma ovis str. Michigan]
MKSNWGAISQNKIKNYRLFWVATDLFDKNVNWEIKKNNYKDFAVIEIEFKNEKSAKEITRNFANKYTTNSKNMINIFGDPLDTKTISKNNDNFYSLGYPGYKDDIFKYSNNWNESKLRADRLSRDLENRYSSKESKLKGHVASKRFANLKLNWGGEELNRMGHFYLLEGTPLGKGSSGSMVIDGSGNLVAVKSIGEQGVKAKNSMSIPLRSKELVVEGNFKTPQYDLILGAPLQKSSYKQQVQKFLQSKGINTWLSSMDWKSKS